MTLNRKRPADSDRVHDPREPEPIPGRPLRSFLLFLSFLAIALLVYGVVAARTAGFREIVSVKNEQWTGARVRIGGSRIAWPYDLVLTDVTLPGASGKGLPSLAIPVVRVGWRPGRGVEVWMDRPHVRLIEHEDGGIEPEELALLGRIRTEADVGEWLEPLRGRAALHVAGGLLEAADPEGVPIRRIEGIRLDAARAGIPGRVARHFYLEARGPEGPLTCEWLLVDGAGMVPLGPAAAGEGLAGRDFWKGIQP